MICFHIIISDMNEGMYVPIARSKVRMNELHMKVITNEVRYEDMYLRSFEGSPHIMYDTRPATCVGTTCTTVLAYLRTTVCVA